MALSLAAAAAIAGGASAASSLGSNLLNYFSTKNINEKQLEYAREEAQNTREFNSAEALKAREFSAQEAQISRDWQERMSNTAYQRSVADLKAAGLNPILAAGSSGFAASSGSSTVGGTSAASSSSNSISLTVPQFKDIISSSINSAVTAATLSAASSGGRYTSTNIGFHK